MKELLIDTGLCTKCGTCVRVCPSGVVLLGSEGYPQIDKPKSDKCIECGQCVVFCPESADTLSFMKESKLEDAAAITMPSDEQAQHFLKTRRSIRSYSKKKIQLETFLELFDTVKQAPSAVNRQPVRWIVADDPEKTKEINGYIVEWCKKAIAEHPASSFALMAQVLVGRAKAGEDVILRGVPHVAIALVPKDYAWPEDGVIALTYLDLAAHGKGIGTCWAGYLTRALREYGELRGFLGIKEDEHVCGALMMGWPAIKPVREYPFRKTPEVAWVK